MKWLVFDLLFRKDFLAKKSMLNRPYSQKKCKKKKLLDKYESYLCTVLEAV